MYREVRRRRQVSWREPTGFIPVEGIRDIALLVLAVVIVGFIGRLDQRLSRLESGSRPKQRVDVYVMLKYCYHLNGENHEEGPFQCR